MGWRDIFGLVDPGSRLRLQVEKEFWSLLNLDGEAGADGRHSEVTSSCCCEQGRVGSVKRMLSRNVLAVPLQCGTNDEIEREIGDVGGEGNEKNFVLDGLAAFLSSPPRSVSPAEPTRRSKSRMRKRCVAATSAGWR